MNEKVKQAVEKLRELDLYDLHSEDFDNILGALNNLEELIKGKDEYIAKLCNDRAELKEDKKMIVKEYNRLFDLAKEQEKTLKIICGKEVGFSQLYYSNNVEDYNNTLHFRFKPSACESMALTQEEFDLVKKVVEKYGK